MKRESIASLHCPYSGSGFTVEQVLHEDDTGIQFGLVASNFGTFPIVNGILRLLVDEARGLVTDRIEARDTNSALLAALEVPFHTRRGGAINLLSKIASSAGANNVSRALTLLKRNMAENFSNDSASFLEVAARCGSRSWIDRETYRFSMRTFLPVYPLLHCCSAKKAILNFGCGLGHDAFLLAGLYPTAPITCVDRSFSSLYLAKRYFVSKAEFICLDGNHLLPFDTNAFSTAFSSDAMQYIDGKISLARELMRVVGEDGIVVFPHLPNGKSARQAGKPLDLSGYAHLFGSRHRIVVSESNLLREFICEDRIDLRTDSNRSIPDSDDFSAVVSGQSSIFRRHDNLWAAYVERMSNPVINPLYTASGNATLRKRKVDDHYGAEITWGTTVCLPETVQASRSMLSPAGLRNLKETDIVKFNELTKAFVVIEVPPRFLSTQASVDGTARAASGQIRRDAHAS